MNRPTATAAARRLNDGCQPGVALLDPDGRITDASGSMGELLGSSPAALEGTHLAGLVQGFSFRNASGALIDDSNAPPELACEVRWNHPLLGVRSGRLAVSVVDDHSDTPVLIARLCPDSRGARGEQDRSEQNRGAGMAQGREAALGEAALGEAALGEAALGEAALGEAASALPLALDWQPIVELRSGRARGIEAFVRQVAQPGSSAANADRGGPSEDRGRTIEVSTWGATRVIVAVAQMRQLGTRSGELFAVLNVSTRHLALSEAAVAVEQAMAATGLPPEALWIDVDETAVSHHDSHAREDLYRLAATGVRIGLDHFGVGYGSLATLRELPVSFVKIDPSFVAGLGTSCADEVIVRSIISLGAGLGVTVIADGVETEEQRALLSSLNCPLGQGPRWGIPFSLGPLGPLGPLTPLTPLTGLIHTLDRNPAGRD